MYRINKLGRNTLLTYDEFLFHTTGDKPSERIIISNIIIAEERFIKNAICTDFYNDFANKKNVIVTDENRKKMLELLNKDLETRNITKKFNNDFDDENPVEYEEKDLPSGTIINSINFVKDKSYIKLWNQFLHKLCVEAVEFMAISSSWVRLDSSGQQLLNPRTFGGNGGNSASANEKEIKTKMDLYIQDRIDPFTESMHQFICNNIGEYPLYCHDCHDCGCCGEDKNKEDGVSYMRKTGYINMYD